MSAIGLRTRLSGRCDLPDSPLAPSTARRWVSAMVASWDLRLTSAEEAVIAELTSELVTNAIQHAAPAACGARNIGVGVSADATTVRLEVHDPDPRPPSRREPDWVTESGRGLLLVEAQAEQWGAVPCRNGKYVWFTVRRGGGEGRTSRSSPDLASTASHPSAIDIEGVADMSPIALPHDTSGFGPHHVIALHGWFGDRDAFGKIRPYLDGSAFTYAFPDCRGYGEARDLAGEFTLAEIAGDVLALADKLGWEDFSLIGHSMGGTAIQRVLADAPDRVRKLVGISPVPASGVPFDDESWALFSGAAEEPANRRAILDLTTGNRLPASWLDEMVDKSVRNSEMPAYRAYLDAWARTDFHTEIAGNTTPVLVIAGEHDPALSPEVMRGTWLQWYPNAELVTFPDAGHYAADESPLSLVASIERFLAD